MKKLLTYGAIAVYGLAVMTGCKKSDSSSSSASYTMSATIGGHAFSGAKCIAGINGAQLAIVGGLDGTAATFPNITINVQSYTGLGTYPIQIFSTTYFNTATLDSTLTQAAPAAYGSVIVTGTSPITGTFSFTCTDSTKVTNGSFSCLKP